MEGQAPQHPPGWYPNPQGPGQRYWDGTKWTDQYQPGAPVQEEKKRGRFGRNCLMVTLGVVIGGVVLIGGCVAILGSALDEAEDEQNDTAITVEEFRSIPDRDEPTGGAAAARAARQRAGVRERGAAGLGGQQQLPLLQRAGQGAWRGPLLPVLLRQRQADWEERLLAGGLVVVSVRAPVAQEGEHVLSPARSPVQGT